MINQLTIGLLQPAMLSATLELDRLCLGGFWSLETYQKEIDSPNSTLLVLTIDQSQPVEHSVSSNKDNTPQRQIIGLGCVWAILEEAHITILAIDPQYQGQGLGELLLLALLKDATRRKLERATLEVKVSNQPAINLYQKFGFKIAGRRKNYYHSTGEDALIMWLSGLDSKEFEQEIEQRQQAINAKLQQNNWFFQ